MSEHSHSGPSYYLIFGILLCALIVSLTVGAYSSSISAIALIYIVATMKAFLVLHYFIHLRLEPRWVKLTVAGTVAVLIILFIGLAPDISFVFGSWATVGV